VSKYKSPTAGDPGLDAVLPRPTWPFAAVLCVDTAEDAAEVATDAVSVSVDKVEAAVRILATSLALVNLYYSIDTTCQLRSSSLHLYICSSAGIGVGASHRHVSSFRIQELKGLGGINASRDASYVYPIPA
jgi:hypothetical protein